MLYKQDRFIKKNWIDIYNVSYALSTNIQTTMLVECEILFSESFRLGEFGMIPVLQTSESHLISVWCDVRNMTMIDI
jgi:hypothetical protein